MRIKTLPLLLLLLLGAFAGCAGSADKAVPPAAGLEKPSAPSSVPDTAAEEKEAVPDPVAAPAEEEAVYTVSVGGVDYPSDTTELVLTDDTEPEALLAALPHLERVDLTALPMTAERIDELEAAYPDVRFIWTVKFGHWTVRSDITCFSTLYDSGRPRYTDEELAPLFRYCRDLVALDVGHMPIKDLTLIGRLTKLKVLILMDSYVQDISPLKNCTELMYLELFNNNYITDFSPLASLTKMEYLNVSNQPGLKDLDFIDTMPELKYCYVIHNWMDDAIEKEVQEARPEVTFCFGGGHPTGLGWRAIDCNRAIRSEFYFWTDITDFRAWDDVDYLPGREHEPFGPVYQ